MPSAVGIELGPSGIRGVVLEQTGQRLRLTGTRDIACDPANPEALTRALTELKRSLRIAGPVTLGVPSSSAILSLVHPLVVVPERAELAVQFELQQTLPFPLSDAAWHYHWLGNGHAAGGGAAPRSAARAPAGRPPSSAAAVAAMRRPILEERLSACRRAGIGIQAVSLTSIAVLNACRLASPAVKASAGGPAMTVLVIHGTSSAEWIVSTPATLQVIPVVPASPDRLWQDVADVWAGLKAQDPGALGSVRVVGTADAVAAAQQALAGQAMQRVDVGAAVGRGPAADAIEAGVGLALHGLGLAGLPLNLLAASQEQAHSQQTRRIASIVGACCLIAAVGLGISAMLEIRGRRAAILDSLEKREQLYQTLRPDVRALLQQQARVEQRGAQLQRLADQGPAVTQALARVADTLPDDIWLTSADLTKSGLIHGVVEGQAKSFQDVTKFFEQLKTGAGMTTVKPLSTSVTVDPASGKESIAFGVQVQQPLPGEASEPASPAAAKEKQKRK
jgi:Tfp pilus assembly protein PilN